MPSAQTITQRFGSLYRALELSGLPVSHRQVSQAAQSRRKVRDAAIAQSGRKPTIEFTSKDLIHGLKRLLKKHGYLSARLIDKDPLMPSAAKIGLHFGSYLKAYELAGYSKTFPQLCSESVLRRYGVARGKT